MKKLSVFFLLGFTFFLYSREEQEKIEPFKLGNLALPSSQWQAPLFSFGQLIIGEGEALGWIFTDYIRGDNGQMFSAVSANFLYGISNDLSIALTLPFTIQQCIDGEGSTGLGNFIIDLEYAYYTKVWQTGMFQATVLGSIGIPLGIPPLASGSPPFFLGTTISYLSIDWYAFTSYGVVLPTPYDHAKFGNEFLYEYGLGHHIANRQGFVIAFVIEMDGVYAQKNRVYGICDPNSGGNTIYVGPSFWIATEKIVIQPGIQAIIDRHLNGQQDKDRFIVSLDFAYSF